MSKTFYMKDGDIYVDEETGKSTLIDGPLKCNQDLAEVLMSEYDPARAYGNELVNYQSEASVLGFIAEDFIRVKVDEAIRRLMDYQKNDSYSTADERIGRIVQILTKNLGESTYFFYAKVETEGKFETVGRAMVVSLRHLLSEQVERAVVSFKNQMTP